MSSAPRVLLYSQRRLPVPAWMSAVLELEDLVAALEPTDWVAPVARWRGPAQALAFRAAVHLRRRAGRPVADYPLAPLTVTRDHALFFAVFMHPREAAGLLAVRGWRERSAHAACFLAELWTRELDAIEPCLGLLRRFDRIYAFNRAAAASLAARLGRPVEYLGMGVDALAFAPHPLAPPRTVDVYAMGRRSPALHAGLRALADRGELNYLYDAVASPLIADPRDFRALTIAQLRRARCFVAYPINADPERRRRTGGEESLSQRYYEGAAGGAVMIGGRTACSDWDAQFGWEDSIVEVPYAPDDVAALWRELGRDEERLARARRRNVVESLRRHDWSYRWQRVLAGAGLAPPRALAERRLRLLAAADAVAAQSLERFAAPRFVGSSPSASAVPRTSAFSSSLASA